MSAAVTRLLDRGVVCPHPETVWVGDDVVPARIAPGAILHPGCRIAGADTSIGPGCVIGAEAPATIESCQLAGGVQLKGGYYAGSVFWDGVEVGSAAHIRPGCLLEEASSAAHAVGLKQTILFPFVTLGSLVNFCDLLMAGGTSRQDHGEVGSSYVHFNFTPHHDKATASLIGDVPRGVLLDQPPAFLGGQGGLVGPRRITFGTVLPAGTICREDVNEIGQLVVPTAPPSGRKPYDPRRFGPILARATACVGYLGQIRALLGWYEHVRPRLVAADAWHQACVTGGRAALALIWTERVKRLADLVDQLPADNVDDDRARREQAALVAAWPDFARRLENVHPPHAPAALLDALPRGDGDYLSRIRRFDGAIRAEVERWLTIEAAMVPDAFAAALGTV